MKTVLVTGAAGFIGSTLTEYLVEQGYDVKAFVRYNSKNNWGWLEHSAVKNDIEVIAGDIRDFDGVKRALKGCDTVYHLAALIGIPYSYVSPLAYIRTNIEGTYNIVEAARDLELSNVLVTSTSETYGTAQFVPITEEHPLVGQSPYSASKIGADQMALSYHKSFDLPVKLVRPFNTYGPRQSARAVIPTIITQVLAGKKSIKLGNLDPTRDLTYVRDTCAGFHAIAQTDALIGTVTNIGMKDEITIRDLVHLIADVMGTTIEIENDDQRIRPDKSEVERLFADNTKLMAHTDWKPEYTLRTGLAATVEFLKAHMDMYKPELYTV